jgi:hypothetical protein
VLEMRNSTRKIVLVAAAAAAVSLGSLGAAQAQHHGGGEWGHGGGHWGGGFGPGFVGGLALGAAVGGPYYDGYGYYDGPYAYDYGPDCYLTRRVYIDEWGRRIIRRIRVCD